MDLEIELINGEELEYELDRTAKTAKVESENGGKKVIEGEEATQTIEALLSVLKIDLDQPIAAMVSQILEHLRIPPEMLKEIDFEIELSEGVEIGFKYQVGVGERAARSINLRWTSNFDPVRNGNMTMMWMTWTLRSNMATACDCVEQRLVRRSSMFFRL